MRELIRQRRLMVDRFIIDVLTEMTKCQKDSEKFSKLVEILDRLEKLRLEMEKVDTDRLMKILNLISDAAKFTVKLGVTAGMTVLMFGFETGSDDYFSTQTGRSIRDAATNFWKRD